MCACCSGLHIPNCPLQKGARGRTNCQMTGLVGISRERAKAVESRGLRSGSGPEFTEVSAIV
jgi:hypothetical protein